jgi:hypothetical protein
MSASAEAIYGLLPAWIRLRDQTEGGGVLRALVGVLAAQAQVVSEGLDELYDNQFIETCAPWVVPYIGDLVAFRPLRPLGPGMPGSTRAEVADTIGLRRRKGTLSVLEQLGVDVTGWPSVAVEYFERLATTQYVRNHLRPGNRIVDVRSPVTAIDAGSAFDLAPHTADVRRISSGRGRYNIPNIGLFVWRLRAYASQARPAALVGANRFTFDPLGRDVPLVNPPRAAASLFALAGRPNVPYPLQRYPLHIELEGIRAAKATGTPPRLDAFAHPPFAVRDAAGTPIPPEQLAVCDLSSWTAPTEPGVRVGVDPVLGRLAFAAPVPSGTVTVDFRYAFSGDYGGGPYHRTVATDEATLEATLPFRTVPSFATADLSTARLGVVEIPDSGIHAGDVALSPGTGLLVVRADDQQRPVVAGAVSVAAVPGAAVTLRGLGVTGSLTVTGSGPFTLRLEHCTVLGTLDWSRAIPGRLVIDHSLCGPVLAHDDVGVTVDDSALDAGSDAVPALSAGGGAPAGSVTVSRSTVLGSVSAREIPLLENSVVTGLVTSVRHQDGCVRYCYLPLHQGGKVSATPRRFRCQPELAVDTAQAAARRADPAVTPGDLDRLGAGVEARVQPVFTSRTSGQPGYLQLADRAPDEIRYGAEEGDEMGIFFGLFGPRREANLQFRLSEYLRIGLETGVIHAS